MNDSLPAQRATFDDLMRVEGHAELIGGRIVHKPNGLRPILVAFEVTKRLFAWAEAEPGRGRAYPRGITFRVAEMASGRESFLPDSSYVTGPFPAESMDAYDGVPAFAVEVRSKEGYGPEAEAEASSKRADYFAAGTLVVWDVDAVNRFIDRYQSTDPPNPTRFGLTDEADAEPAVPGWRVRVGDVV